ncbi:hypothetical protein AAFN86_05730 [Roseomonas sp. CAU 1739]
MLDLLLLIGGVAILKIIFPRLSPLEEERLRITADPAFGPHIL